MVKKITERWKIPEEGIEIDNWRDAWYEKTPNEAFSGIVFEIGPERCRASTIDFNGRIQDTYRILTPENLKRNNQYIGIIKGDLLYGLGWQGGQRRLRYLKWKSPEEIKSKIEKALNE